MDRRETGQDILLYSTNHKNRPREATLALHMSLAEFSLSLPEVEGEKNKNKKIKSTKVMKKIYYTMPPSSKKGQAREIS